jgi:hypothetical protein
MTDAPIADAPTRFWTAQAALAVMINGFLALDDLVSQQWIQRQVRPVGFLGVSPSKVY